MKSRAGWYIEDWAGNVCFPDKTFETFDDGFDFLSQFIERTYPATVEDEDLFHKEINEYAVTQAA